MAESSAEYNRDLYFAGDNRWLRYSPASGREEVLVANPRLLPHFGSGGHWASPFQTLPASARGAMEICIK
jgi:hypothetical protein